VTGGSIDIATALVRPGLGGVDPYLGPTAARALLFDMFYKSVLVLERRITIRFYKT